MTTEQIEKELESFRDWLKRWYGYGVHDDSETHELMQSAWLNRAELAQVENEAKDAVVLSLPSQSDQAWTTWDGIQELARFARRELIDKQRDVHGWECTERALEVVEKALQITRPQPQSEGDGRWAMTQEQKEKLSAVDPRHFHLINDAKRVAWSPKGNANPELWIEEGTGGRLEWWMLTELQRARAAWPKFTPYTGAMEKFNDRFAHELSEDVLISIYIEWKQFGPAAQRTGRRKQNNPVGLDGWKH